MTIAMSENVPAGHFRLLYFASAASFTQKSFEDFSAPLPLTDLFNVVEKKHPGMIDAVLSSSAVTVNLDYVDVGETSNVTIIREGDEVAIIPPVSSG